MKVGEGKEDRKGLPSSKVLSLRFFTLQPFLKEMPYNRFQMLDIATWANLIFSVFFKYFLSLFSK